MSLLKRVDVMLIRSVGECDAMPRGYAPAWYDPWRSQVICAPVGLHLVLGLLRAAYQRLRMAVVPNAYNQAFDQGFFKGAEQARRQDEEFGKAMHRQGFSEGRKAMLDELESALKR